MEQDNCAVGVELQSRDYKPRLAAVRESECSALQNRKIAYPATGRMGVESGPETRGGAIADGRDCSG